jgi:hypothetical protein
LPSTVKVHSRTLGQATITYAESMIEDRKISNFSQSNPTGKNQGDPAALLRRVADSLDSLGDVQVQDIVFNSEPTADEDDLTMTVYCHRQPRRR